MLTIFWLSLQIKKNVLPVLDELARARTRLSARFGRPQPRNSGGRGHVAGTRNCAQKNPQQGASAGDYCFEGFYSKVKPEGLLIFPYLSATWRNEPLIVVVLPFELAITLSPESKNTAKSNGTAAYKSVLAGCMITC